MISWSILIANISSSVSTKGCSRIDEGNIIDLAFLYGYKDPTFTLIYEDEPVLHLKTYEIIGKEPLLRSVQLSLDSIEPDSKLLIPVPKPYGGVIIVGDNIICYQTKDGPHTSQYIPQSKASQVLCYASIDALRYLIGDSLGRLYMVHLLAEDAPTPVAIPAACSSNTSLPSTGPRIGSIRIELLGEITTPECISYLDNGVIFIGSALGNSQLMRLNAECDSERNSYLTLLDTFNNVGPIVDMLMLKSKGQNQLVTCSGAYKDGSIRIIRNGIGVQEFATIDQSLIKGVWCFPLKSDKFDDTIIVTMANNTKLLRLDGEDFSIVRLQGLLTDEQTLYCSLIPMPDSQSLLLQATTSDLRLIGIHDAYDNGALASWRPPNGRNISTLNSWHDLVLVASGADLYLLKVVGTPSNPVFEQLSCQTMPQEVACIDLTPFCLDKARQGVEQLAGDGSDDVVMHNMNNGGDRVPQLAAVGLWMGGGVALLQLPSLAIAHVEPIDTVSPASGNVLLPRAILIAQLEQTARVICGMGEGSLYIYTIYPTTQGGFCLREPKCLSFGTGPAMSLRLHRSAHVFVCTNHPCVIYSRKDKLVFANLNVKQVNHLFPLNGSHYTDCIVLVTPTGLVIGMLDEIQKLHIRTVPLDEAPRRLAYQPNGDLLAVLSSHREVNYDGSGFKPVRSSLSLHPKIGKSSVKHGPSQPPQISADRRFHLVDVWSLLIFTYSDMELHFAHTFFYNTSVVEIAISVTAIAPTSDYDFSMLAVGTAFLTEEETEPDKGRIHLFKWDQDKKSLETILVHDVSGAVYRLIDFNGRILAAVNSSVRLFKIKNNALSLECHYNDSIIVLFLRRKGDFILIGDLMRSLTLLLYKPTVNAFELVGRHRQPRWTTCVEFLDDDHFLAAEVENNLFVTTRDCPDPTREPSVRALLAPTPFILAADGSTTPTVDLPDTYALSSFNSRPAEGDAASSAGTDANQPAKSTAQRSTSNEFSRLTDCAYYHTGDFINTIVKDNLVLENTDEHWAAIGPTHMHGSVSGCLGMIVQISPILFAFLREIEARLAKLIVPVGGFSHDAWRAYKADRIVRMSRNFIDGDLIETILDLNGEDKAKLVAGLKIPINMLEFGSVEAPSEKDPVVRECLTDDLIRIVEELIRIH